MSAMLGRAPVGCSTYGSLHRDGLLLLVNIAHSGEGGALWRKAKNMSCSRDVTANVKRGVVFPPQTPELDSMKENTT